MFVWTQVRHALQHTAAMGALSPYFAVACVTRLVQMVFTSRSVVGASGGGGEATDGLRRAEVLLLLDDPIP